jgi:hypothetical protein
MFPLFKWFIPGILSQQWKDGSYTTYKRLLLSAKNTRKCEYDLKHFQGTENITSLNKEI